VTAGIEKRTIDDPEPMRIVPPIRRVADSSEADVRQRELPATLWRAGLGAVRAIAGRPRPEQGSGLRRAGAGAVTVSVICAAAWLACTGVNATSQSTESVSTHVQRRDTSSPKSGDQPLAQGSAAMKSMRIARASGARRASLRFPKTASEALAPEVSTAYGNSLSRLERALKMSTQRSTSEAAGGLRYEQEF
jgi:hypothetical protein